MSTSSAVIAAEAPAVATSVRLTRLLPLLVFAVVLVVAILTVTPWPVGAFQDDAIYTVLAKALATGEGYRMINLPGAPHATHYPPLYPAVLAGLWRVGPAFPDNLVVFKFANAAFLALAATCTYAFARSRLDWEPVACALAALAGTISIVVLLVTGVILSEPLFMALLLPGLLLAERSSDEGDVRLAAGAGLLLGLLTLVRTLGAVAIPAAVTVLLWRRRPRAAFALAACAAALIVPWLLWVGAYESELPAVLVGKYGSYGPWLFRGYADGGVAFARDVVLANVRSVHRFLGLAFMPLQTEWTRLAAALVVACLLAAGLAAAMRRAAVTALFLAAYLGVVLLWPFDPERFVLAVWPLLVMLLGAGALAVWRWRPAVGALRAGRLILLLLVAVVATGFLAFNTRGYRAQWWASVQRDAGRRAKPIAEWVARYTNESDVVATDDDLIVYLYTGRRALPTSTFLPVERLRPLTDAEDRNAVRELLALYRPRYFITTSEQGLRTAEALSAADPPLLRPHGRLSTAFIFARVNR